LTTHLDQRRKKEPLQLEVAEEAVVEPEVVDVVVLVAAEEAVAAVEVVDAVVQEDKRAFYKIYLHIAVRSKR